MDIEEFKSLAKDIVQRSEPKTGNISGYSVIYPRTDILKNDALLHAKTKQLLESSKVLLPQYRTFLDDFDFKLILGNITIKDVNELANTILGYIGGISQSDKKHVDLDPVTDLPYMKNEEISFDDNDRVSIAFIDMDNLREVNKRGQDIGDEALKHIANNLRVLEKYGCYVLKAHGSHGDEFLVIGKEFSKKVLFAMIDECREAISSKNISGGVNVTVSCGIASYPEDGKSVKDVLKKADSAQRLSKENGKNKVTIFERSRKLLIG
jgi:diguanylate cyclase (GGDEF)-like protein